MLCHSELMKSELVSRLVKLAKPMYLWCRAVGPVSSSLVNESRKVQTMGQPSRTPTRTANGASITVPASSCRRRRTRLRSGRRWPPARRGVTESAGDAAIAPSVETLSVLDTVAQPSVLPEPASLRTSVAYCFSAWAAVSWPSETWPVLAAVSAVSWVYGPDEARWGVVAAYLTASWNSGSDLMPFLKVGLSATLASTGSWPLTAVYLASRAGLLSVWMNW